ncbi:4Fe-4S binding protein [Geomonas oryzisoli]|uniref:4Fe-4S binding protein n=1 Tax=Geomonas oryzisoli TaxID=2847992 RepID=A0ABX8JCF6_9BACT|nr:4Fe-4S binding protein [Geomonas oryzisoli]QWV93225.1 4Fe-4S binding protein [Geomonas oryzisoli]
MTLSRKDFFRGSWYAVGEFLLGTGELLRGARDALGQVRDQALNPPVRPEGEDDAARAKVARVDDSHCPARSCGCFACLDRCAAGAISFAPGRGIVIDEQLCTGCGECLSYCPLAPQALALVDVG